MSHHKERKTENVLSDEPEAIWIQLKENIKENWKRKEKRTKKLNNEDETNKEN